METQKEIPRDSQKVENSETRKVGPMVGKKDYTRKIQDER
jgi:hypothetical protein